MRFDRLKHVDLNLLVAFAELARTGSVTLAAEALGITQSAMSRTLGRLRVTFGDPLFSRGSSGLEPTPRAVALMQPVQTALEHAEAVVAGPPRFDPASAERTFTIATADYGAAVLLPGLLQRLAREAPKVSLQLLPRVPPFDGPLEKGEFDLVWSPRQPSRRAVVWTRLLEETFTFVVRKGHPATKGAFTLDRFCSLRHLAIAPSGTSGHNPIDERLERLGKHRQVVATVPNFLAVPALLASSDLGVVLPRRIFDMESGRGKLQSLPLPFEAHVFTYFQGWHERVRKDPGHTWFRQLVVETSRSV
jgi:DNA-binding transcriptional LysR family regulator